MNDTCFIANLFTTLLLLSVLSTNTLSDSKVKKQRKPRRKRIVITI